MLHVVKIEFLYLFGGIFNILSEMASTKLYTNFTCIPLYIAQLDSANFMYLYTVYLQNKNTSIKYII